MNQKPNVWVGEHILRGQIIASASGTKEKELALGQNLAIAYLPWEGYNFEDSIIVSDKLVYDNASPTTLHPCLLSGEGVGCQLSLLFENGQNDRLFLKYCRSSDLPNSNREIGHRMRKNPYYCDRVATV